MTTTKQLIEALRSKFPNVKFSLVGELVNRTHEDAFYPLGGAPKATKECGVFLRMENKKGGCDTLRLTSARINDLAAWHNNVTDDAFYFSKAPHQKV